ncbi:hypothetical protein, partial [Escherichia fergusonii]|uniref:hypothetical protein n=1 Tax=Escherichia fergusonii TaxID=564 RepID=UPI00222FD540
LDAVWCGGYKNDFQICEGNRKYVEIRMVILAIIKLHVLCLRVIRPLHFRGNASIVQNATGVCPATCNIKSI